MSDAETVTTAPFLKPFVLITNLPLALLVPVYFFFPDFAVTLHPFLPEGILPDTYFSKSQIEFTFGWFGALEDAFLDAFRLILPRLSIEKATTFVLAEIVGTVIV